MREIPPRNIIEWSGRNSPLLPSQGVSAGGECLCCKARTPCCPGSDLDPSLGMPCQLHATIHTTVPSTGCMSNLVIPLSCSARPTFPTHGQLCCYMSGPNSNFCGGPWVGGMFLGTNSSCPEFSEQSANCSEGDFGIPPFDPTWSGAYVIICLTCLGGTPPQWQLQCECDCNYSDPDLSVIQSQVSCASPVLVFNFSATGTGSCAPAVTGIYQVTVTT